MNGDAFKRAQAGQRVEFSARSWNAMLDAAQAHKNRQHERPGGIESEIRQADIVLVKNTTAFDLPRYGVLGIDSVIFTAAESLSQFQERIALRGTTPTEADHKGKFVILLEPLKAEAIGRAWVSGVCVTRVDVVDASHKFCDVADGCTDYLRSSSSGSARILYSEPAGSGGGQDWCVVRLGDSSSGDTRLGTISATWTKGTTATVTQQNGDGTAITGNPTFTAANHFATIAVASGTKRVACALVGSTWILIAAEC